MALSLEIPELDVNATYDMDTIVMKIAPVNGKGEYKGKIGKFEVIFFIQNLSNNT